MLQIKFHMLLSRPCCYFDQSQCLAFRAGQEKHSSYQKDDLWVLSNQPSFGLEVIGSSGAKLQQGWLIVAHSIWHGPNREGRFVHTYQ